MILQRFSGVEVKPLFYYSTIPAQNVLETYNDSLNASSEVIVDLSGCMNTEAFIKGAR
jgi:hypothetical protein